MATITFPWKVWQSVEKGSKNMNGLTNPVHVVDSCVKSACGGAPRLAILGHFCGHPNIEDVTSVSLLGIWGLYGFDCHRKIVGDAVPIGNQMNC